MEFILSVDNLPENRPLIEYLRAIRPARAEFYTDWNKAVEGDENPRLSAESFDWTISSSVLADKIRKRFATSHFDMVDSSKF